ncbi:hypothetical protein [Nocardiopsis valliformis]|uniref:hypothetical protein n=1 Tax=Nocardiopsis valliformis TaxID=239974 RepID=UPI000349C7B3|nr:hypothetical protein [Nocardiopsis valliformis]
MAILFGVLATLTRDRWMWASEREARVRVLVERLSVSGRAAGGNRVAGVDRLDAWQRTPI